MSRYKNESITSGYRPIQDGAKYDRLIPKPEAQDRIIIENGEVEDTVALMAQVVWRYIDDTQDLAPQLQGATPAQSAENIWNFLYHHIQYRLDERGLEQLRRPARAWADRKTGIDCDCFSIFASSLLTQLSIAHAFRIAKYDSDYYQHVYVVVPTPKGMLIIDPVLSRFNYEKPFSGHKDFPMNLQGIDVAVLSGPSATPFSGGPALALLGATSQDQLEALHAYLMETRAAVAQHPAAIAHIEDPEAFLAMLDYAIGYWYTDQRDEALAVLAQNEERLNLQNGLSGEDDFSLGAVKRGFFSKIGDAVKKVASGVKDAATTAAKAVVKYNPLTVTSRLGFLLALKLNLKKMGTRLKWAYATREEAGRAGVDPEQWSRAKEALVKLEALYADKLQGKREALKDAILKGRAGGLNGAYDPTALGTLGLGEPVSMGAAIAAATPLIIAAVKLLKDAGLFAPGEDLSTDRLLEEAQAAGARSDLPAQIEIPASTTAPSYGPSYAPPSGAPALPAPAALTALKSKPALLALGAAAAAGALYWITKKKGAKPPTKGLSGTARKKSVPRKTTAKPTRGTYPRMTLN